MRRDMRYVVIEKERHNSTESNRNSRLQEKHGCGTSEHLESLPKLGKMSMGFSADSPSLGKNLSDNLNPLRFFLKSRLGRKWDDIYSEIRENLNADSALQKHILEHISDFVITKTWRDPSGELMGCRSGYNGAPRKLSEMANSRRFYRYYVCPDSGILKEVPQRVFKKEKPKPAFYKVSDTVIYKKVDGQWYEITLEPVPRYHQSRSDPVVRPGIGCRDVLLGSVELLFGSGYYSFRNGWVGPRADGLHTAYGTDAYYGAQKRQLSSKEIARIPDRFK